MPIYPGMNERIDWYLPLVGGAEMNRLLNKPLVNILYTSRPYPVIAVEGFGSTLTEVRALPIITYVEAFAPLAGVVSGSAEGTIYSTYRMPDPDAFTHSASVVSGSASGTIYSTYRMPDPDAFIHSARVTSGSALVKLITYRNYEPEGFNVSASVISGAAT